MSDNTSLGNVSGSNIASETKGKTQQNAVDDNDFIKLSDIAPEEDSLPPIFFDDDRNMLGYGDDQNILDLDVAPALPTKKNNVPKSVADVNASKETLQVSETLEQAMISSSTDTCQSETNPIHVLNNESIASDNIVSTSYNVVFAGKPKRGRKYKNERLPNTLEVPINKKGSKLKKQKKQTSSQPVESVTVNTRRRKCKNLEPLQDMQIAEKRITRRTVKHDEEDLLRILQDSKAESDNLQKVIVESVIPKDFDYENIQVVQENDDSISAINKYINDTSSCKTNGNIKPVMKKKSKNVTKKPQKKARKNYHSSKSAITKPKGKAKNTKSKPRKKGKLRLSENIDSIKVDKSIEAQIVHSNDEIDANASLHSSKQIMEEGKLFELDIKIEDTEMEIDDMVKEPLLLTSASSLDLKEKSNTEEFTDDDEMCLNNLKKEIKEETVGMVEIKNEVKNEMETDIITDIHSFKHETTSNTGDESKEMIEPSLKRTPKKCKSDDFEYDMDKVVPILNKSKDDTDIPLYSEDGRPLRKKARQKHYDENSDEDPYANVELSDDEYSDAEYFPYKKQRTLVSEVNDVELNEFDGNNLKRKRNKTKSKNYTHENKGLSTCNMKVVTNSAVTDVNNDIENCLETSVITIACDDDQSCQDGLSNILGTKKLGVGLEIKKVTPKGGETSAIPPITIPLLANKSDISTQTKVPTYQSTSVQTTKAELQQLKKNVTLTAIQRQSACEFLTKTLNTTSELGQLMTTKSDEFISKKITPSYIKDTSKIDYCAQKAFLLLKLAKENISSMEETLHAKYIEYLSENNLLSSFETPKTITPQSPPGSNDSDCEIVEAPVAAKKASFNPKTVFLNKELSIKIAKKPTVISTPPKKDQTVKKTHSVWINNSIMVKKVKPQQSFLAKDGRCDKPPDLVTEEQVKHFFDNYYNIHNICSLYTSSEWLTLKNDAVVVCNYFSVENHLSNSNDFEESNSEQDVLLEGNANETIVSTPNPNYDFLHTPTKVYEEGSRDAKSLLTLCIDTLSKTFLDNENVIEIDSNNTQHSPNSLVVLSLKAINSTFQVQVSKATNVIELKESSTISHSAGSLVSMDQSETMTEPLSLFKTAFEKLRCCMGLDNFDNEVSDDTNREPWRNFVIDNITNLAPEAAASLRPVHSTKSLKLLALEITQSCFNMKNEIKVVETETIVKSLSQIAFESVKGSIGLNNFENEMIDKVKDRLRCNISMDNFERLVLDDLISLKPVYCPKSLKLLALEVIQTYFNSKNKANILKKVELVNTLAQIAFDVVKNCVFSNHFENEMIDKINDGLRYNISMDNIERLALDDSISLKPVYCPRSLKSLTLEVVQTCFISKNKTNIIKTVNTLAQTKLEMVKNCLYSNHDEHKVNNEMWSNIFVDNIQRLAPDDTISVKPLNLVKPLKLLTLKVILTGFHFKIPPVLNTTNVIQPQFNANASSCLFLGNISNKCNDMEEGPNIEDINCATSKSFLKPSTFKCEIINDDYEYSNNIDDSADAPDDGNWYSQIEVANLRSFTEVTGNERKHADNLHISQTNADNITIKSEPMDDHVAYNSNHELLGPHRAMVNIPNDIVKSEAYDMQAPEIESSCDEPVDCFEDFVRNHPTADYIMRKDYLDPTYGDDSDSASNYNETEVTSLRISPNLQGTETQCDETANEEKLVMKYKLKEELLESDSDLELPLDANKIIDQAVRSLVPETFDVPEVQCNDVDSTQSLNTAVQRKRSKAKKIDAGKRSQVNSNLSSDAYENDDRTSKKDEIETTDTNKNPKKVEKSIEDNVSSKKNKEHTSSEIQLGYVERNNWHCYLIDRTDVKLHSLCSVPLDKLPEEFVKTYNDNNLPSDEVDDCDLEIRRLTNLNSLNRTTKDGDRKRGEPRKKEKPINKISNRELEDNETSEGDYDEFVPSDDDYPIGEEECSPTTTQNSFDVESSAVKKSLLREDEDSDNIPLKNVDESETVSNKSGPKSDKHPQLSQDGSLVLTVDKMMKKELDLLHAPILLDKDEKLKSETDIKTENENKPSTSCINKTRPKNRQSKTPIVNDDSSSEEEKLWVNTKSKLLKRMEKKVLERNSIDDARRTKLVSEYIEKQNEKAPGKRRSSQFRRRQRELLLMQMGESFEGVAKKTSNYSRGRKNIRKVLDKKSLAKSTVIANMEEFERKKRIITTQTRLRELFGYADSVNVVMINDELCLEFDFKKKVPVVTVHKFFTNVMKTHQYQGVKFLWDACFESVAHVSSGSPGGGCILAHCMGLGKTLQVLALLHTVLTHPSLGVRRVLVCCPLSTVLNWVDEIHKWLNPITTKIKVFELSKLKKLYERAYQLEDWYKSGGIFIIGYELFRSLSTLDPVFDRVRPTIVEKIMKALLDPGPDIIVCDEGHLLKNDSSVLAIAMNRVKTKRRIVLTGTPMQNNLREYFCMVNFIKPNLLGTYSEYSNRFENPIMNGQHRDSSTEDIRLMKARTHILHKVLEGCLQRQEVSVLYPYLPRKYEYTVLITLTKCQSNLYRHYLNEFSRKSKHGILKDFHILQKIWSHPQVLHNFLIKSRVDTVKVEKLEDDLAREDLTDERDIKPVSGEQWWLQYLENNDMLNSLEASNKFDTVFRILDECVAVDDKVLIFSTSLFTLDALEYFLKKIKNWSLGYDYYRLDGSVPAEVRQKWCREFNCENNITTKLFLISTRAGCLGLNMTAANRVILFDTSWNPAHDIQSIFRVYRFGQSKDCYIYRLVAMGTMEQKIYERSVTKQAVACRVVDELQIDRHYNLGELAELYRFEEVEERMSSGIAAGINDAVLLHVARNTNAFHSIHEHDSLLRDTCEQQLPENERQEAWDQFQLEQTNKHRETIYNFPIQTEKNSHKRPMPPQEQNEDISDAKLDAVKRICLDYTRRNADNNVGGDYKHVEKKGDNNINAANVAGLRPDLEPNNEETKNTESDLIANIATILMKHNFNKGSKTDPTSGLAKMISSLISKSETKGKKNKKKTEDVVVAECIFNMLQKHLKNNVVDDTQPSTSSDAHLIDELSKRDNTDTSNLSNKNNSDRNKTYSKKPNKKAIDTGEVDTSNKNDVIQPGTVSEDMENDLSSTYIVVVDETKCRRKMLQKIEVQSEIVVLSDDDEVPPEAPSTQPTVTNVIEPIPMDNEEEQPIPLHPKLLTNDNFTYIIATGFQKRNPDLDEQSALLAAEYSIKTALDDVHDNKLITSGPIYDVTLEIFGKANLLSMWDGKVPKPKPPPTTSALNISDEKQSLPKLAPIPLSQVRATDTKETPSKNKRPAIVITKSQVKAIKAGKSIPIFMMNQPFSDSHMAAPQVTSPQLTMSSGHLFTTQGSCMPQPTNVVTGQKFVIKPKGNVVETQAQLPTTQEQAITTQDVSQSASVMTGQKFIIKSKGNVETPAQLPTTQGQVITTQGNYKPQSASVVTGQKFVIKPKGNVVETQAQLPTSQGQAITTQGNYKPQEVSSASQQYFVIAQRDIVQPHVQLLTANGQNVGQVPIVTQQGYSFVTPDSSLINKQTTPNNRTDIIKPKKVHLKPGQFVKEVYTSDGITDHNYNKKNMNTSKTAQSEWTTSGMSAAEETIVNNTPVRDVVPVKLLQADNATSNRLSNSHSTLLKGLLEKPSRIPDSQFIVPIDDDVEPIEEDVEPVEEDFQPVEEDVDPVEEVVESVEEDVEPVEEVVELVHNNVVPVKLIKANYAHTSMEPQVESILPDDSADVTINLSSDDDLEITEPAPPQTKQAPASTGLSNKGIKKITHNDRKAPTNAPNMKSTKPINKQTKKEVEVPFVIKTTQPQSCTRAKETVKSHAKTGNVCKKQIGNALDKVTKVQVSGGSVAKVVKPAPNKATVPLKVLQPKGKVVARKSFERMTIGMVDLTDDDGTEPPPKQAPVKSSKTIKMPEKKIVAKKESCKRKAQPKTDAVPLASKKKKTYDLPLTLKDFSLDDLEDIIELE